MNKFISKILVVIVMFSLVSGMMPSSVFANSNTETVNEKTYNDDKNYDENNEEKHENISYGCELSDLANYYSNGLIVINPIVVNDDSSFAYFLIKNKTNCNVPVSLSSYKMFDNVLSHQEFFDGSGLVNATTSTLLKVKLPSCMAQIDAWYGEHPKTLLDSNPYAYPNVPFVLAFKFIKNSGTGYHDASGDFCVKEVKNTPPVITLNGINPDVVYLGTSYIDPGAIAQDNEDGDITPNIVITGNVDTNTLGTYTLYYNVKDSKGLSATQVKRKVNVVTKPVEESEKVIVSTTKIVCAEETDLPNWGAGGPDISSSTALDYVSSHPNCRIVPWTFEWAYDGNDGVNPGDSVKVAGGAWSPFIGTTSVDVSDTRVWVREQFDINYIPFTGVNTTQNVSAELYCDTDVLNYDNYDYFVPSVANKTYYCVAWNVLKKTEPTNTPPVITLIGNNPIDINVGDVFTDPGATAQDNEDGDITLNIIASSTVNSSIPGVYYITYNVKDSQGLSAEEVKRTVNVLEVVPNNPGKITFCLLLADSQNNIATSSALLPQGSFSIQLGTTSGDIASSTFFQTKNWDTETFSPNRNAILSVNDSDCITYDNLPYGTYTYSELLVNGNTWNTKLYNDQDTQPVNNIFDFFNYGTSTTNADGYIILGSERSERVLYIVSKFDENNQCVLPEITSSLSASVNVNNSFSYVLTSSSTDDILSVATTTLPSWLNFATSTNTLSGTPTQVGTYSVDLIATNSCGFDSKILVIDVTSNGGGGGGGSATSDLDVVKVSDKSTVNPGDTITYTITVVNHGPNDATNISLNDSIPSTLSFVSSSSTVGSYATSTGIWTVGDLSLNATSTLVIVATVNPNTFGQRITNTANVNGAQTDPNTQNNTSSSYVDVNGDDVCTSNCGGGGGGGGNGPISTFVPANGPIVTSTSTPSVPNNSCYYLFDYLRKDFNNNPVEVKKLQVFLKDLEGESLLQVTGIYDDQTIEALNRFQNKYKDDILTPWGHTEPTSYTYILTKKKVNEIYCKIAFPVTVAEQSEIDSYRNFLQSLLEAGIDASSTNNRNEGNTEEESFVNVGINNIKDKMQLATLAGYSSSTQKLVGTMTANLISGAKKLLGSFTSLFGDDDLECKTNQISYLNIILILIILTLIYLWYKERKNNINIEEINKEIDLN